MRGWKLRCVGWRKRSPAVQHGKLQHFAPADGVYVYFRYDGQDTVMVALNKNPGTVSLALDRFADLVNWMELWQFRM